ncbi:MAG: GntR family transcriptional regulator [Bacilli bacterium]|nr:GntR family transcriptional regulator [Bacilli bacterium]
MDSFGKKPIFETIADYYRRLIAMGVLKEGDALPSVREVAVGEGVNPNTVARAYSLLCEEGIVESVPKKGYFVKKTQSQTSEEFLLKALKGLLDKGYTEEQIQNALTKAKEERP